MAERAAGRYSSGGGEHRDRDRGGRPSGGSHLGKRDAYGGPSRHHGGDRGRW